MCRHGFIEQHSINVNTKEGTIIPPAANISPQETRRFPGVGTPNACNVVVTNENPCFMRN